MVLILLISLKGRMCFVNLPTDFPASSLSSRYWLASKQISKLWYSRTKKKIRKCSYSGPGLSKKTKESNFLMLGPSHTPLCKNQTNRKAHKKPLRNARLSETLTYTLAILLDIKTSFCALIRRRTITMVYAIPGPAATQAKFLWFCIAP